MWKYYFGVVLSLLGCFFGYLYTDKYKKRTDALGCLSDFAVYLSRKISYENTILPKAIKNYRFYSKEIEQIANEFIVGGLNEESLKIFEVEYRETVKEFFRAIGKSDVLSQTEMLKKYSEYFFIEKEKQKKSYENKKKIALRLGFFSGVALFIVLV